MEKKEINGFTPPHSYYLSPYSKSPLTVDGITYNSVQQAFFACLTDNLEDKIKISKITMASDLRKFGESLIRSHHTQEWQLTMMETLLRRKFNEYPILGIKLKNTFDQELKNALVYEELFWGLKDGIGENHIGKIEMKIRTEMLMQEDFN